ncbi:MAG: toprim domain-containing protein [Oscillospiraceae bacterium]|nr:toprim domain-containing protein [Oscillospiraceae bacterium]
MPFILPEAIHRARELDLLTYLQNFDSSNLVKVCGDTYCTKEHDSLKISNGKWNWFSRGIGGKSALDYLIKVEGMKFTEAVEHIMNCIGDKTIIYDSKSTKPKEKALVLPKANCNNDNAISYLKSRGIDKDIINYCVETGRIYESYPNHNVVMLGFDKYGIPRYANLRGIGSDFKGEASGSDKRFSFSISAEKSDTVHIFESAIDLLSYATMLKINGQKWDEHHLLSLAGVYRPDKELKDSSFPLALKQFLSEHSEIKKIHLRLDNDYAGRIATEALKHFLSEKYEVKEYPSKRGKDYNDWLCLKLGIPIKTTKPYER